MNDLLKSQIHKFLPKDFASKKSLQPFFEEISKSYSIFEKQQVSKLINNNFLDINTVTVPKEESDSKKNVIAKLNKLIDSLGLLDLSGENKLLDLDAIQLIDFIGNQTNEIIKMCEQRDGLLSSLKKQNDDLNNYAHMVSHDLKAPLRNIDTLTSWLKDDYGSKLDNEGKRTIQLIRSNVERMEKLISGILVYSSLDEEAELYDINLNYLIDEILDMINVPEDVSIIVKNKLPIVKGDKFRFIQLFQNLIHNAIVFNNKEKCIIKISCSEDINYWNFCIKDNGKGIEEEYLKKIFEVFQKLDNKISTSGIGLSIVKKIVEKHEGTIYAKSELGKGTAIYFNLKKS